MNWVKESAEDLPEDEEGDPAVVEVFSPFVDALFEI